MGLSSFLAAVLGTVALLPGASPAGAAPLRGVALQSTYSGTPDRTVARDLDDAVAAGSTAVRTDVIWGALQFEGRGRFSRGYVAQLDRFMAAAARRDLRVVATLWSSPCWASAAPASRRRGCRGAWWERDVGRFGPRDPRDLGRAAEFLTRRYGTRLAALELWNEPNLPGRRPFLMGSGKAARYARMLRAAYPAAKRGDPRVPVLAGALAYADLPFVRELYRRGAKGSFDGLSVHPYVATGGGPESPGDPGYRRYTFGPGLEDLRAELLAQGDAGKELWVTEFGWTTARDVRWAVDEATQARYTREAFGWLARREWVGGAFVYALRNQGTVVDDPEHHFGLITRTGRRKPVFGAVADALAGLRG